MISNVASSERSYQEQRAWFEMIVGYLKARMFITWMRYHPRSSYEEFDLQWPSLFDQMCATATKESMKRLRESVTPGNN